MQHLAVDREGRLRSKPFNNGRRPRGRIDAGFCRRISAPPVRFDDL
jgi:hypothetical protein